MFAHSSTAVAYWENRLIEKLVKQIELDFNTDFESLRPHIAFETTEEFISESTSNTSQKDSNVRITVVYEPFLFSNSSRFNSQYAGMQKTGKKSVRPFYFVSIMNDFSSLSKVLSLTPNAKLLMLFCITSREDLLGGRVDGDGKPVSIDSLKVVFSSVDPRNFLAKAKSGELQTSNIPQPEPGLGRNPSLEELPSATNQAQSA